jgi:hypothetical protein
MGGGFYCRLCHRTLAEEDQQMDSESIEPRTETRSGINLPAPTAWPLVAAFGVALLFAGLVTTGVVSILGAILAATGFIGWFRDVLPQEKHEFMPVVEKVPLVATMRSGVARVGWITHVPNRAHLPLEIYPISAGVKGGLAGGVAMAVLAMLYGIISGHGIWYPINLLSAGFFPGMINSTAEISAFHWDTLITASMIHLVTSLLVGLLYGATLPMFPRRPILWGGLVAPILWSGLLHSILEFLNPVLNRRINWMWFVISQIGFGVVAGIVVSRQYRVRTWQSLPLAVRVGMETSGVSDEKNGDEQNGGERRQ